MARVAGTVDRIVAPGGMFGQGSVALNQLLVVMDGIGEPAVLAKVLGRTG